MSRGFRVWDNQVKSYDWDREFVLSPNGNLMELWSNHNGTWDYHFANEDRFIVERDTGLKDKNGKEICEGDMVKIWDNKYSGSALGGGYAIEGHWFPMVREVKMDTRGVYAEYPGYMLLRNFANIEVIGNIHENKELLGGEE